VTEDDLLQIIKTGPSLKKIIVGKNIIGSIARKQNPHIEIQTHK